ncbi:MAG: gamma-glutamyl hercynylcysteine S-oxide synthase [Solirubrobacteraceae bacterium]|nr:gamma-glutamyl hercynylcysteine S-oxide synthase [Solirubrobacteraceae bacterium]
MTDEPVAALTRARERTLALVAAIPDDELERVHSTLMSPLVWDLGHIAAFEDLWLVHRFGGDPMVRRDLAEVYDAFETPRFARGDLPFLRAPEARAYLEEVRARARAATERLGAGDGVLHELVVRHELQHSETMQQTMALARINGGPGAGPPPGGGRTGLELVDLPGGPLAMGAPPDGFAYDNERPRHEVEVAPFRIGRAPVSNGTWMRFAEGGGYERREWWSSEAWQWKEEYDITHPLHWSDDGREWRRGGWEPLHPDRPVVHVSWFEADAFARAHGARLPTEAEWEWAATSDQEPLDLVGEVWEWTDSPFSGYPGFAAFPYPEYSEVFFDEGYRVLRGGSWATSRRVASPTFRNWDWPDRRQIFSGVRIASGA